MARTRSKKAAGIFLAAFGSLFLLFGGVALWVNLNFVSNATEAAGVILENVPISSRNNTTFAPKYTYKASDGVSYTTVAAISSSPPDFAVGQTISVLYSKSNPADSRIDDAFWLYGFFSIFAVIGSLLLVIGTILARRHWHEKIRWE